MNKPDVSGLFPLPKGGGPIEALTTAYTPMASTRGFHYRKAVAPLKPLPGPAQGRPGGQFPLPKGGGPIEARKSD